MSKQNVRKLTVALAGNPNVGKSTLFNTLTGLHQHTGNWPGKTVGVAQGTMTKDGTQYTFVDLPGTYSLDGKSEDERIAGEFLESDQADCTVVVCDGSSLERSLILALQILQKTDRVVVCINLMDEAMRHGISVDAKRLSYHLNAPVVLTAAGKKVGMDGLIDQIRQTAFGPEKLKRPFWDDPISGAEQITADCVLYQNKRNYRRQIDRLLVSRRFGVPLMFFLLLFIIWLTVWGANYPSELLERGFDWLYGVLSGGLSWMPLWLRGILLDGVYATCARVISVMLPPMAIFFPCLPYWRTWDIFPEWHFCLTPAWRAAAAVGSRL